MALRPAPKRKVDYQKLDDLQNEIFGSAAAENETAAAIENEEKTLTVIPAAARSTPAKITNVKIKSETPVKSKKSAAQSSIKPKAEKENAVELKKTAEPSENLSDMETIAAGIATSKAGQGRNTTRPFSLPRTLIIDTTRLKAKFRTIDEQFTQNIIIDFLLREALALVSPANYKDLRAEAYEFIKRPDETTRRSLTVTEDVVYQMSELKAGINLETGKKYSNDEILSTLLAIGVSQLYRNQVLN